MCQNGSWNFGHLDSPICLQTGCPPFQAPENVQIVRKYESALIEAWCHPGHTISGTVSQVGKRFSYKDEREWKRRLFLIVYRKLILPDK